MVQAGLGRYGFRRPDGALASDREVVPPRVLCPTCQKDFAASSGLAIHVALKHPERFLTPPALALEANAVLSLFDTPFFANIRALARREVAEAPAPSAPAPNAVVAIDAMELDEPEQDEGREKKTRHRYTLKQKVKMLEKVSETAKVIAASRSISLDKLPAKTVAKAVERATGVPAINIFKWLQKKTELEMRYVTLRNRLKKAFGGGRPPLFPQVLSLVF